MKYIKYILFFIPHLLVTWACWLTNPIACLFPVRQPNGRDKLWGIFELWSTFDNPVDEGYYGNYFCPATPMGHYAYDHSAWTRYVYRLKWLSRNTGYGYHNDFNIGWRDHAEMDKLDYAGRIIGLRRS